MSSLADTFEKSANFVGGLAAVGGITASAGLAFTDYSTALGSALMVAGSGFAVHGFLDAGFPKQRIKTGTDYHTHFSKMLLRHALAGALLGSGLYHLDIHSFDGEKPFPKPVAQSVSVEP